VGVKARKRKARQKNKEQLSARFFLFFVYFFLSSFCHVVLPLPSFLYSPFSFFGSPPSPFVSQLSALGRVERERRGSRALPHVPTLSRWHAHAPTTSPPLRGKCRKSNDNNETDNDVESAPFRAAHSLSKLPCYATQVPETSRQTRRAMDGPGGRRMHCYVYGWLAGCLAGVNHHCSSSVPFAN
jgi:hypothetical protein